MSTNTLDKAFSTDLVKAGARSRVKLEIISRYPSAPTGRAPLLFIHGMFHGAWCWDVHFLDYFARHGYAAHAVNLRGHGGSAGREKLRGTRIADYVADVAQAAGRLPAAPVLIGHSMGGFTIQKYLEEHAAPAAVLLSSPPPSGMLAAALRSAARHPLLFAKANLTLSLFPLVGTPRLAGDAFFSPDMPGEELADYWSQMQDDSFMALLDMVALDLPDPAKVNTRMLVLGAERDHMLSRSEIEATARAYHTRAEIIPGVAHNSMLELRWEAVAERILSWLEENL